MVAKTARLSFADIQRAAVRDLNNKIEQRLAKENTTVIDRSIDLLTWSRKCLPAYFTNRPSAMHEWLATRLQAARYQRGTKINVLGPRGGAKSTIGNTAHTLRCAVEGTERYILILGKTSKLANKQLGHVRRELEENQHLAAYYPESCGRGPTWSESELRLRNGVQIQAFGIGQDIRGSRNAADRPSLVVGDDLQDNDVITSALTRENDWTWFTSSVLKIGNPQTNFINLATATHREAISWRLLDTPGWESGVFASIINWPDNMGLWEQWAAVLHDGGENAEVRAREFYEDNRAAMNAGAVVLWPEHESLYDLMVMRESEGRRPFDREKQSKLAGVDENEWPDSYFDPDRIYYTDDPIAWRVKTMVLDPSKGKDARRSDYSAIVKLTVGVDNILYVDADLERRPTPKMISDAVSNYQGFRPDAFGVEANAWQELLSAEFMREFQSRSMLDAAPWLINNTVNKQVRIRRLGPYLAQGRIKFKANSPGAKLVVSQLRDFPDIHSHDDGPDALEMAHRLAIEFTSSSPQANPVAETLAAVGFQ